MVSPISKQTSPFDLVPMPDGPAPASVAALQRHWQAVTEADPAAAKGYLGYVLGHMERAFEGEAEGAPRWPKRSV